MRLAKNSNLLSTFNIIIGYVFKHILLVITVCPTYIHYALILLHQSSFLSKKLSIFKVLIEGVRISALCK